MLASFNLIDSMSSYHFYDTLVTASGAHLLPIIGGAARAARRHLHLRQRQPHRQGHGRALPVMGVLYIIMALIVMVINAGMLPEVLRRISRARSISRRSSAARQASLVRPHAGHQARPVFQ